MNGFGADLKTLFGGASLAMVLVIAFSLGEQGVVEGLRVATVCLSVCACSGILGGFLGFLFGIPRYLAAQPVTGADADEARFGVNTNLEVISDWLTKLLVGAGLVQFQRIGDGFRAIAAGISQKLVSDASVEVLALAMMGYSLLLGFIVGYLATRLRLPTAFAQAERESIGALSKSVDDLVALQKADARALGSVHDQLTRSPGEADRPCSELFSDLKNASDGVRVTAFNLARHARKQMGQDDIRRAIPVFEGLIAADERGIYHRNHAQRGYALKDMDPPRWKEALAALSRAIEMRGEPKDAGRFYELNRAICRIRLDSDYIAKRPTSDATTVSLVLQDLRTSAQASHVKRAMDDEAAILSWLKLNDLSVEAAASVSSES